MFLTTRNQFVFAAFSFLPVLAACGQTSIPVTLDPGHSRSVPGNFYGINGQGRNGSPWAQTSSNPLAANCSPANPGFVAIGGPLQSLEAGILRFPAGTGANYWNWSTGDFVTNYYTGDALPSCYPSFLSELSSELSDASQSGGTLPATQVDFVLNMLTDTKCTNGSNPDCNPGQTPPNLTVQETMLNRAYSLGISVPFVELGNEYYLGTEASNPDACYAAVYSGGNIYATTANTWIPAIRGLTGYSSVQIAAVGAHIGSDTTRATWNQKLMNGSSGSTGLTGADAVTLHVYTTSGLTGTQTVDSTTAETMLYQPFLNWDGVGNTNSIEAEDMPSLTRSGYTPDVWVTEYNLRDSKHPAFGTWAHGLYTATMSLLFLEDMRITMAIHHETQGTNAIYPDILESTNAFAPPELSLATNPMLPGGVAGAVYSYQLNANGGVSPYTFTYTGLPSWITTHSSSGLISGTAPLTPSTYSFTAQVTDSALTTLPPVTFSLQTFASGPATLDCSGGGISSASAYPSNGASIVTTVNGFSAQGLTTREVDTASLGATHAQELLFTGASTFGTPAVPVVYGWEFTGGPKTQIVILNLSDSPVELNIPSSLVSSGSVHELYSTDPGTYVTGAVVTGGYGGSTQPITQKQVPFGTSPFLANQFKIQPFSITRITAN
jgi:hypothetical protein